MVKLDNKLELRVLIFFSTFLGLIVHKGKSELFYLSNRKVIENEQPKWLSGKESGCYGSSYYWLIDQLIRRIDKQKRGVQQYFHDEIASQFGM